MDILEFERLLALPESDFLDFKSQFYHSNNYAELLKDVISFANSHAKDSKYIVFGVKDKVGVKELIGLESLVDQSLIDQLLNANIEPYLVIQLHSIEFQDKKFQVLEIKPDNRPYLMKKKYNKLDIGSMWIRKGATNESITRADLDKMYNDGKVELEIIDGVLYATRPDEGTAHIRCRISNFLKKPITLVFGYLSIFEENTLLTKHRLYGTSDNIVGADYQMKLLPNDEVIDYFEFGFSSENCLQLEVDEYGYTDKELKFYISFFDAQDREYSASIEQGLLFVKGDFLWKVLKKKGIKKIKQPR